MLGAGEATTFFIYLEGIRARWIDASGNVLARLNSQQIAERQVRSDNTAFRILRNGNTNRQDLHDRLKLRHPLLQLSIKIANLLFGGNLAAYVRTGAEPTH